MGGPNNINPHTTGPLKTTQDNLKNAIANIDRFVSKSLRFPNLDISESHGVATPPSRMRQAFLLIGNLISSCFKRNSQKAGKEQQERLQLNLMRSVDIIKNHHLLLDRFKKGDDEQQKLALSAMKAIHRYNQVLYCKTVPKRKLVQFLLRRCGWEIPDEVRAHPIDLPQTISVVTGEKGLIDTAAKGVLLNERHPLGTEEIDAFRMKAISMILKHTHPCLKEIMKQLRSAPISATKSDTGPVIALAQHLNPFPGEVIEVKGAFQRSPTTLRHSVPILESFSLFSQSTQTGFPHPCQHTGFALADELVLNYPHRPALLKTLSPLLERKKELALSLLPKGALLAKGKKLLQLKQTAFDNSAEIFVKLHRQFALLLYQTCKGQNEEMIGSFYQEALKSPSPFQAISKEYEKILRLYISVPFYQLQEAWVEHRDPRLHDPSPQVRMEALAPYFDQPVKESDFVTAFGSRLARVAKEIVIQQFSEKMEFAAPPLSKAAKTLQALLYKEQYDFLKEFEQSWEEADSLEKMRQRLSELIRGDIQLLQVGHLDILNELADYYTLRFEQITRS